MWSLSAYWGLLSWPAFFIWDSWQEGAHKSSVKLNRSRGVQFWLLMFPLVSRRICSQNLPAVDILRESESIARVPCHKRVPVFLLKAHVSLKIHVQFQFSCSLCLTLCNPMDCSTLGLPVHHQLLEFTQTHVHWVGDAIQPSHLLLPPSPTTLNVSQHQGNLQCRQG